VYPTRQERIKLELSGKFSMSPKAIILYVVFGLTVFLWVTEAWHGLSSSVVAFLPIAALTAFQVIEKDEIRNLSWEVLWLMAGGIALGVAMQQTGLAEYLIGLIRWELMGAFLVIVVFGFVAAGLSNFISNTVAASLLVPLAVTLGASGILAEGVSMEIKAIIIAVGASLGMALPISTPPNAIAMSSGMLRTPDMAKMGIVIGIVGLVIAVALSQVLWPLLGL
jgi:solute carrier family 13 (sodium-dependent dicarboxylate transporter), member 2/3/5